MTDTCGQKLIDVSGFPELIGYEVLPHTVPGLRGPQELLGIMMATPRLEYVGLAGWRDSCRIIPLTGAESDKPPQLPPIAIATAQEDGDNRPAVARILAAIRSVIAAACRRVLP